MTSRFYRKRPLLVMAERATEAIEIRTANGPVTVGPGTWIVQAPSGDRWPVPDHIFREEYEEVDRPVCHS